LNNAEQAVIIVLGERDEFCRPILRAIAAVVRLRAENRRAAPRCTLLLLIFKHLELASRLSTTCAYPCDSFRLSGLPGYVNFFPGRTLIYALKRALPPLPMTSFYD
jgi:hypothetical protein